MAGRIRDESIADVREKARIDDVVGQYVTLRNAGGGSQKGLCPFHDEKTPSFNVCPARGHCTASAARRAATSSPSSRRSTASRFVESVERLADKYGVELKREEGDVRDDRPRGPAARQADRGQPGRPAVLRRAADDARRRRRPGSSSPSAASTASPPSGSGSGSRPAGERTCCGTCGSAASPRRSASPPGSSRRANVGSSGYDRFRGRLLWPIRETSGETIGFGARRIFEDDKIEAKYLNTPETTLYKKSRVLYGIDLARKQMGLTSQAVVVEGYTDVMACHLAGVGTAVASCGTAFGDEHAKILRRHMADHEEFRGEVIFTFDGDEAGQKAAIKAFEGDQNFASQTYVAVEPDGLDPCDLRIKHGDAAVRELVARRVPLYRFVLGNVVEEVRPRPRRRPGRRAPGERAARRRPSATSPRSTRSPGRSPG